MQSLRLSGETEEEFRLRVERVGTIAHVLVDACLQNRQIQRLIETSELTREHCIQHPTVRVEFEQAIAIGGIGETLAATRSKHWGNGPWVLPLLADDEFYPDRITYIFRENSLYNRRFEQRNRLKQLLGKRYRSLVEEAKSKYTTKAIFLRDLTAEQTEAIRRSLQVEAGEFWRACKGKVFLDLPKPLIQRRLFE